MSSLIHLTFTILFTYLLVVVFVVIVIFLSISVSPAPCLQSRHTGRGCSQALLALLSNWPIRGSRSDHHSLPLLSPFRALHHHPLHLPAKVRHTGRSWPHQLPVNTCWVMSHLQQQDVASELEKCFLVARNSQFNVTASQYQDVPCCVTEAKHTGRSVFPSVQLILVTVDPVPFFYSTDYLPLSFSSMSDLPGAQNRSKSITAQLKLGIIIWLLMQPVGTACQWRGRLFLKHSGPHQATVLKHRFRNNFKPSTPAALRHSPPCPLVSFLPMSSEKHKKSRKWKQMLS